jgi:hypothetical protein
VEKKEDGSLVDCERLSLWRELSVAQTLLVAILLESLYKASVFENLDLLSDLCKDSKRKRQPQLSLFNSS